MLNNLPTKQEIIEYLTTQNFMSTYVCGDGTLCEMFTRRVDPTQVQGQSIRNNSPKRMWWIERDEANNKFILRCSYFALDDTPITYEQFYQQLVPIVPSDKFAIIPAIAYTSEAVIEWLPTAPGEWTATYSVNTPTSGCMIAGALSKIKLPSAIGHCYYVSQCDTCGDSETINWTTIDGVQRTGTLTQGSMAYICSSTVPYETPIKSLNVVGCGSTCEEVSTNMTSNPCLC